MTAIGFRDKSQCLNRNVFIFLMSKFHESKVTFLESSAPSGRDTGSHHGMLHHSVITENHSQSAYRKQSDCPVPSPIHTSTVQHLHLRLRSQREGRGRGACRKTVRARGPGNLLWDCLLEMSEKLHPRRISSMAASTRPKRVQYQ